MRSDAKYGTNDFDINSWKQGHSAKSSTGSLRTDGTVLFSYRLPIGYNIDNVLTALDYTSPDYFYSEQSVTTSIHVGKAKSVADVVATPDSRTLDALTTLLDEAKSSNKPTPPKSYDGYCTVGMTEKTQDTPDGGWELVYEQGCKCKAFTPKQLQYDACNCGHHIRNHEFRTEQQIADFAWEQENL